LSGGGGARDGGIVVTGIGVVTSVGSQAAQALTSIAAGICRFRELPEFHPLVRDTGQHFPAGVVAAPADTLTKGLSGVPRLLALGRPALQEALADAELDDSRIREADVLVAGADRADTRAGSRAATILPARLLGPLAAKAEPAALRYFPSGSAAGLIALDAGMQRLRRHESGLCVVGGVDSWLDTGTLAALDGARRLKTAEITDGFVPGEAAAFLVLERAADAARRGRVPYARCNDVQVAREEHTVDKDTVCTGEGLTRCLRPAVDQLRAGGRPARAVLCDLNGESYRSTEWAYALARVFQAERAPPPTTLVHPADCIGDVGGASAAVLIALGARAIKRRPRDWDPVLVWCSSDGGDRAACSLEAA
jgi:3-oxoacyl-[acyl-carrier-protein] synthase-1